MPGGLSKAGAEEKRNTRQLFSSFDHMISHPSRSLDCNKALNSSFLCGDSYYFWAWIVKLKMSLAASEGFPSQGQHRWQPLPTAIAA